MSAHGANTPEHAQRLAAAQRLLRVKQARADLLRFTQLSMPHAEDPADPERSRYQARPVHRYIADMLQRVERGEILRLILTVQPRVGKSELVSNRLPAWFVGQDAYRQVAVASYADSLAQEFGREVREVIRSPFYRQVFPGVSLRRGSQSVERLQTTAGGVLVFVGVGTGLTGKGADLLVIDDPIKDDVEANSKATRDKVWAWFNRVALTRLMGAARVVICMTRWHEDDLVGRLTNPKSSYYNPDEARKWTVVNIPAFAEDGDPVGRRPGEILWPERTSRVFLESMRRLDPHGFAALYLGRPAPPEGHFFKAEHIRTYQPQELPKTLRYYAASDHAVSEAQSADPTCMGCVGVDTENNVYVMPDITWRKMDAAVAVEAMLDHMRSYHPLFWWAEKGHISKSIGPFLRVRMSEEGVHVAVDEKTPVADKQTRAQAIQGRMAMGKVFLPAFAPWYQDAKDELLNFPHGTHDDFVDFLAWIGQGLAQQTRAQPPQHVRQAPPSGTIQWIVQMGERLRVASDNRPERRYLQ